LATICAVGRKGLPDLHGIPGRMNANECAHDAACRFSYGGPDGGSFLKAGKNVNEINV
jgi:hypothetical protein